MIRIAARERVRSILCSVLLLTLALSSVEVLWAEEAELPSREAQAAAADAESVPQAPTPEEADDCPCMCACACLNVQSVVIPDTPGQKVVAMSPMRAPATPWPGPSHLLPEPLLPPPRS